MNVLITAPYILPEIDRFRPIFTERGIALLIPRVNERMEEADLLPLVGDIDGTICGDDRYTARVLDAAPKLRVIAKWGTGIDSIDREACAARGVAVLNTPNAFSEPVADSALGYMLCFARRLPWMDRTLRETGWRKIPSVSLGECILGIIGVGNVGRAVARRATAFGMRLLGCDPVEPPTDLLAAVGMTMVDLPTLLEQSDFISINCDLNPTSLHLINEAALARVKPDAVLINTARGPVIDEPALVAALQASRLAGAALDVFEDEPLPDDSPLRTMEQVMLAPHNANSSPVAWERVHKNTIRNLLRGLGLEEGHL